MIYLGVEYGAKYVLEGPNGVKAVFNDSTDADYVGDLSPESSGLDAPEMREDSADRVEADGAIFGDFFAGKRPVILQGTIIATSKAQRNERVGKLRAASNAKTSNATLWWEDAAAGKVFVNLRRQQPLRVTKGYVKEFQLSMVSADSRILSSALRSEEKSGIEYKETPAKLPGTVNVLSVSAENRTAAWTNIANIKAEDAVFATDSASTAAHPQLIVASNFGHAAPSGATLIAAGVEVKGKSASTNQFKLYGFRVGSGIQDLNPAGHIGTFPTNGALFTATNTMLKSMIIAAPGSFPAEEEAGKFGEWRDTVAQINASDWGVMIYIQALSASAALLSVDDIKTNIRYSLGPQIAAENRGTVNAPAKFIIKGAVTNPTLVNEQTGARWAYSGKVNPENFLVIDTEAFTVVEIGPNIVTPINRYNNVTVGSNWIQIEPGINKVILGGTEGEEAKLKVEWRDAWE